MQCIQAITSTVFEARSNILFKATEPRSDALSKATDTLFPASPRKTFEDFSLLSEKIRAKVIESTIPSYIVGSCAGTIPW